MFLYTILRPFYFHEKVCGGMVNFQDRKMSFKKSLKIPWKLWKI